MSGTSGCTQGSGSTVLGQGRLSGKVLRVTAVWKAAGLALLHAQKPAGAIMMQLTRQLQQATKKDCIVMGMF